MPISLLLVSVKIFLDLPNRKEDWNLVGFPVYPGYFPVLHCIDGKPHLFSFRDYRLPPCNMTGDIAKEYPKCDEEGNYSWTPEWWHILVARLVFVLVFEVSMFWQFFLMNWTPYLNWVIANMGPEVTHSDLLVSKPLIG